MAGPINSIFASITETLATVTGYSDAAAWCSLGATNLAAANVPPRIVWVPTTEGYGPAQGQGGSGVTDPRPVATRLSYFQIHLWAAAATQTGQVDQNAKDLDACELLLNAFMWSVYSKAHGAQMFDGQGRWAKSNADGTLLTLGVAYILPVTFKIPVTRPPQTLAPTTSETATIAIPTNSVTVTIT